jgi:UDP-glucuronate 4-epimerase
MKSKQKKVAIVTGSAGFIGFHTSQRLLTEGWRVVGIDCMSDYYDVSLKQHRESILLQNPSYRSVHEKIETPDVIMRLFEEEQPNVVIHLAAQAGVRHSVDNPREYLNSNILGTFEILEAARRYTPEHLLLASTSSAYGSNEQMPYREIDKTDHQMSFYAASKKSTENMAHSYAHLFGIPITVFRFFTVYGPWGRPDMALFKFTEAILNKNPIDVYNYGDMRRDFTYIDDLVHSVFLLISAAPKSNQKVKIEKQKVDSISPVAPFRTVNIGGSKPEKLLDFIKAIESCLNTKAIMNFLPMQPGDISQTWADTRLLQYLVGYQPNTGIDFGVKRFVDWYREYFSV